MSRKTSLVVSSLLAVVAALAALAATRPATRQTTRSATLAAPPSAVLAQLADLRLWAAWSPWPRADASVQRTFGGPPSGVGASCYFSEGSPARRGRMTLLTADPGRVELELEYEGPRPSSSDLAFELAAAAAGTRVTWTVTRQESVVERARAFITGSDTASSVALEEGLARLGAAAEAQAKAEAPGVERSIAILASPAVVHAQLADLRRWSAWSPWERLEPGGTYGGPSSGVGSSRYWLAPGGSGWGRMTVTRATAERIEVEREVVGPRRSSIDFAFDLVAEGGTTRLAWTATGQDASASELANDFEKGLAQLKSLVEAEASR